MEHHRDELTSYLRTHRKHAGLTQREIGRLLGCNNEARVSRYELFQPPSLHIAISYEIIFRVSVSKLFPSLRGTLEDKIESRILEFRNELEGQSGHGSRAPTVARKLLWLTERDLMIEGNVQE